MIQRKRIDRIGHTIDLYHDNGYITTEGASTLPIAQVKGLKDTCHYGLMMCQKFCLTHTNITHNKSGER